MDAIAITAEQADRYHQAQRAMRQAGQAPARTREAAAYTRATAEGVAVVIEVAKANGVSPAEPFFLLDALALTDPESRTRALTTEETDAYLRGHLMGYRAAIETEVGVVIPLHGEEETVLSAFDPSFQPMDAWAKPLAYARTTRLADGREETVSLTHRCAVCQSALEPSQALPGAYLHVDDEHEDHMPVLA